MVVWLEMYKGKFNVVFFSCNFITYVTLTTTFCTVPLLVNAPKYFGLNS